MAKQKVKEPVDEWREHLERNLKAMADSWSNLADTVSKISKLLKDARAGASFTVTKELLSALDNLKKVTDRCPIDPGGPDPGVCIAPPNKPGRRTRARKQGST